MSLPPPAEIPPSSLRLSISPEEWEACLESWLSLSELYLRLPEKEFATVSSDSSPLVKFVESYYHQKFSQIDGDSTLNGAAARRLERTLFRLVHRMLHGDNPPRQLLGFSFIGCFCHVHTRTSALSRLLDEISKRKDGVLQKSMLHAMEPSSQIPNSIFLRQLSVVTTASTDIAALFMTGSDFLDGLNTIYTRNFSNVEDRRLATAVAYLGLSSLAQTTPPQLSLLTDHLYSLKASADKNATDGTLLRDLVTNTSFIAKLRRTVSDNGNGRLLSLLDTLDTYRQSSLAWPRRTATRKRSKGKGKSTDAGREMHMHRMSLVTQVQDLFPDLGSGFVLKLLDEYNDDVEQVTAHLLDDSLPPHLRDLDRSEQAPEIVSQVNGNVDDLAPRSAPPPRDSYISDRRNVFDDDELDRLAVDASRLHVGKKEDATSKDQPNKAAILSALAAFDSDDDERDDTYDVDDVGGTIDTANPGGEPGPGDRESANRNDMVLFGIYASSPDLFARTPDARKKKGRQDLKSETGMTDEAIEGWAIMLQRDPKRLRRLEAQYSSFDGKQAEVARTAYREGQEGTETEESDGASGRGGYRGGYRGRGGRGRGGNVAGPSGDPSTANAQRRKEANKSSRANHNRRNQRAKKMGRGGFAG